MYIPATDLLSGLNSFVSNEPVKLIAEELRRRGDLEKFVQGLSKDQLEGRKPIIEAYQPPITGVDGGCELDLYWNPGSNRLSIDWSDVPTGNFVRN
ncbi:hypothetical protein J4447_00780 [Candidatus Pacearchaeota archaeon]|nr:hypothetical protein [Candidatus Pacearchaeota archaeon]